MAEERVSPEFYSTHEAMEAVHPSDVNLSLLSTTEKLSEDVIFINPATPPLPSLPAVEHRLWMDAGMSRETRVNASEEPVLYSVKAPGSVGEGGAVPLFGPELLPTKAIQRAKVIKHQCSECSKVFGTSNALNKHLLTHQPDRPHVCKICQRGFKRQDHLTGHMLTHQKREAHHCPQPSCQKTYYDQHSLRRHCSTQHGLYLLPASLQPHEPHPVQPTRALWEPTQPPSMAEGQLDYHSLFLSSPKAAGSLLEAYSSCGGGCAGFTPAATNLGLNCYPEEPRPPHLKIGEGWESAVAGAPRNPESAGNLATSHGALPSHLWTMSHEAQPGSRVVDPTEPENPKTKAQNIHGWESSLHFSMADFQAWKEVLSVQPCEDVTGGRLKLPSGTGSPVRAKHSRPILLKHQQLKHQQHLPYGDGAALCSGSHRKLSSEEPPSGCRETQLPLLHLPPASKTRKKKVRNKSTKTADIPLPPLPAPRPSMQKRPRHRSGYLVSPSQVAMASFNRESTTSLSVKGSNVAVETGDGRESGASDQSSLQQALAASFAEMDHPLLESVPSLQRGSMARDAGLAEESPGLQLSPLVIPVSVPVSDEQAPLHRPSVSSQTEKVQSNKALSRKSRRSDLLSTLVIPHPSPPPVGLQGCRAAGGYPSQLRSPGYLADHLLTAGFHLPPYTPPPMLSPLRPGTGLYFSTLPKHQPCPPPPGIYTAFLDGKDGISLRTDNMVVNTEPRINVGARFQAEIPPLRNPLLMLYDEHPAQLVWAPWGDLPNNLDTQHRVTEFLDMCCSSVLPGGGTNIELALHCLHEVQGDILAALDLLLVRGDYRTSSHPLSDYHYAGSDHWSAQEMRLFQKALLNHSKDFQLIHRVLQTKAVAQCVEYYYSMKKVKKFKQRTRGVQQTERTGEISAETLSAPEEQCENRIGPRSPIRLKGGQSTEKRQFTCEECGRGFHKVKSRSAHMKTHRQREKGSSSVARWFSGDHSQGQGEDRSQVIWNPVHS